jgi:hypothetical protein
VLDERVETLVVYVCEGHHEERGEFLRVDAGPFR